MRFYFVLCAILVACHAKVYFKEDFNDKNWEKRWIVPSDWKPKVCLSHSIPLHHSLISIECKQFPGHLLLPTFFAIYDLLIYSFYYHQSELGEWKWTHGENYADAADKGIQTGEDAKFYGLSAKFDSSFTNTNKDLVIQLVMRLMT